MGLKRKGRKQRRLLPQVLDSIHCRGDGLNDWSDPAVVAMSVFGRFEYIFVNFIIGDYHIVYLAVGKRRCLSSIPRLDLAK